MGALDVHRDPVVSVPITGSGTDANNPSSASCATGEQAVGMRTQTGAGLDSLRLQCQPTTCR